MNECVESVRPRHSVAESPGHITVLSLNCAQLLWQIRAGTFQQHLPNHKLGISQTNALWRWEALGPGPKSVNMTMDCYDVVGRAVMDEQKVDIPKNPNFRHKSLVW